VTGRGRRINEYVLADDKILSLSRRGDVIRHFPFLKVKTREITRSCGCNRTLEQKKVRHEAINGVKRALISLPKERIDLLKTLLGAETLTLYIANPNGIEKHSI
jgi:hypothetical protein